MIKIICNDFVIFYETGLRHLCYVIISFIIFVRWIRRTRLKDVS